MPAKQRPSDLDASLQATDEYERLVVLKSQICREKSHLIGLKKRAKGKEKQVFTKNIVKLELVNHFLLTENTNNNSGLTRRYTLRCMYIFTVGFDEKAYLTRSQIAGRIYSDEESEGHDHHASEV